ncbi:MAG: hypothetical protein GIKADHBN_02749 [Phycisphaerales bacterium]|nr:hypothetical protein [Phycisphaerales bacterium]
MSNVRVMSVLALTGLALCSASAAAVAPPARTGVVQQDRYVEKPGELEFSGQLIVRPARGLSPQDQARARAMIDASILKYYPEVDEYVIKTASAKGTPAGTAENEVSRSLMATGLFQYAVPNWICYPLATPNDPLFSSQWHHQNMQSELGWNISTGNTSIITAYTDTGIDLAHPDLAPKRVPGFDAPNDLAEADGGSVAELHGHGTHVAGCGAAYGNNGEGVAGVNWDSKIMMIRVAFDSSGGAYYDDLMQGARWAIEHGAKTVSASYSGVAYEPLQTTGEYIKSIGGLYFYAAGNDSANLNWFDWEDVVVVGASDSGDNRAWFSAYGPAVDVFAPGDTILSSTWGGGYGYASGTSMATPVANGVASLAWSINPNLTPDQVESILFTSCDDLGDPGNDAFYGWGRVNVYKVAQAALATTGPAAPTANDDSATAIFGEARLIDVLANDFDPNGDPIELISFNATSSHGGTVTLSPGTGPSGRDQLEYNAPPAYVGVDTFTYTITDNVTGNDTATVSVNVADASLYRNPDDSTGAGPGVDVSYYVTAGYSMLPNFGSLTAYLRDVVNEVNYPSTGGVFATSGRSEEVGAVYEGFIDVPSTDNYTLYTESDDGSKLYVGSQLVVNNDGLHGMVEQSGTIGLKKGTHRVRVEFWENFGGAGVIVRIAGGGLAKQAVPAAMWLRECGADFDQSGFADTDDFDAFVTAFEAGDAAADFDRSGFVDTDDFDAFVRAFEAGC